MQRRGGGQAGQIRQIRERALARRNVQENQRRQERFERFANRMNSGMISNDVNETYERYNDEMKDNEIGPKRPKYITPSSVRTLGTTQPNQIQYPTENVRLPQTAVDYHNQIVQRRNENISRVLDDIRNTAIPMGMQVRGGRRGLFVNNLDRNINQAINMRAYRFSGEDEKQN
jgi:hypothetical protein